MDKKLILLGTLLLIIIGNYAFVKNKYLDVYLMSAFHNDSISIRTNSAIKFASRLTTDLSVGQATSIVISMKENDSMIVARDEIRHHSDSIKYNPSFPYLYIYYSYNKFTFNYSKKILWLE